MTSLVALATKDAVVLGCDSLGTTSKFIIDLFDTFEFFDPKKDLELKKDKNGNPLLKDFNILFRKAKVVPHTHMTHMSKLFSLKPLEMGIMSTGIASIGDRTIKSLIEEFKEDKNYICKIAQSEDYTVKKTAEEIHSFISNYYETEYPDEKSRPYLEFILGGYDRKSPIPKIFRIKLLFKPPSEQIEETLEGTHSGIVFGGQMKEIQRIVFGTDFQNVEKISKRHFELLRIYRENMNMFLKDNKSKLEIPELSMEDKNELDIFSGGWTLEGFNANWGDFSEQNAIECVDFFVNIMIKSQQFCEGMPTVGGEVHIALITKTKGFQFISREGYHHGGNFVPQ